MHIALPIVLGRTMSDRNFGEWLVWPFWIPPNAVNDGEYKEKEDE